MTEAERAVLILTADLVLMASRAGYSTLDQIKTARERLIKARHELDGEAVQLSMLAPEPPDKAPAS